MYEIQHITRTHAHMDIKNEMCPNCEGVGIKRPHTKHSRVYWLAVNKVQLSVIYNSQEFIGLQ
jgi:hypothetical protein